MKKPKIIKTTIEADDVSFVGRHVVTYHGLAKITHVTKERVIFIVLTGYLAGQEEWTWRRPSGQYATFEIVAANDKFSNALKLEAAYKELFKNYNDLNDRYQALKKYVPIVKAIENAYEGI